MEHIDVAKIKNIRSNNTLFDVALDVRQCFEFYPSRNWIDNAAQLRLVDYAIARLYTNDNQIERLSAALECV